MNPRFSDDADAAIPDTAIALDAIELLRHDHQQVRQLFDTYDAGVDSLEDDRKQALAERICATLLVHAQIEEEIFYAAVRDVIDEQELLDEAEVEHACARDLIEQVQGMDPGDALYDAKVKVLGEYVDHHVREEEDRLFPLVELADLDLVEIGAELRERQLALFDEHGLRAVD